MAAKHGLGRGLSSLIPQKKTKSTEDIAIERKNTSSEDSVRRRDFVRSKVSPDDTLKNVQTHKPPKTITHDIEIADPKKPTDPQKSQVQHSTIRQPLPQDRELSSQAQPTTSKSKQPAQPTATESTQKQLAVVGVKTSDIIPNTQQPRVYFDEDQLQELALSIKEHGIMQPLTVVRKGDTYELIAGERRLRAAKIAGLEKVPVIIRGNMDELKKLELAIIENVQRHDLNVVEEGKSYKKLVEEFNLTQEEVAQKMGKSRSAIANRIRLATLPVEIQRSLIEGKISEGHAKVILSLENNEKRRALYEMIIAGSLSVRDTERALRGALSGTVVAAHNRGSKTPQEKSLEDQLSVYFGTKVVVKQKAKGGSIIINYFSDEDLKEMLTKLKL